MKILNMFMIILFLSVSLTYSKTDSIESKIKKIRQEYNRINKMSLSKVTYWMRISAEKTQWRKGKPNADIVFYILANIYYDKQGKIRKYVENGGTDDKVIKREEYFWPNGKVFFVYQQDNYVHAERGDWEVRLYLWNGELIRNLAKKINRNSKKVVFEKYPYEFNYHYKTRAIYKEFNLRKEK